MKFTYLDHTGNSIPASQEIHDRLNIDNPGLYIGFFSYFDHIRTRFLRVAKKHKKTIDTYPKKEIPYEIQRLSPAFRQDIIKIFHLFEVIKEKDTNNRHWKKLHQDTHNCVPLFREQDKTETVTIPFRGEFIETERPNTISFPMFGIEATKNFIGPRDFDMDYYLYLTTVYFFIYYANHCFLTKDTTYATLHIDELNTLTNIIKPHQSDEIKPRREHTPWQAFTKPQQPLLSSLDFLKKISYKPDHPLMEFISGWFDQLGKSIEEISFTPVTKEMVDKVDRLFLDIEYDNVADYADVYAGLLFLTAFEERWTTEAKKEAKEKSYRNEFLKTKKEIKELKLDLHRTKETLEKRSNQKGEIENLKKQLLPLQNVRDQNKLLREDLDNAQKEIDRLTQALENRKQVQKETTIKSDDTTLLEKLQEKLNHDKAAIIGGNPSWLSNMKTHFPKARYYDAEDAATRISRHIRNMDTVLMNTQYMNHPTYKKTTDILNNRFDGQRITIKGAHINADLILKELAEGFGLD